MRISTKAEFVWSDRQQRYLLVSKKSIFWTGPVGWCKGASQQQTQEAAASQKFNQQQMQDYSTQFANQNAILSSLQKSLNPILAAGPNQYGFSQAQTNVLNSQAIQGTGQQYANAQKALNEEMAAAGGGNAFLPSGVQAQQRAQLASTAANQASNQLLGIQQAGYNQGYNMYTNAVNALSGTANTYNPLGYSNAATSGSNAAFGQATDVQKMQNAASPWGALGGALGGIAGTIVGGPMGGAIGSKLGSSL